MARPSPSLSRTPAGCRIQRGLALTGLRKRGYAVRVDRADNARGSVYRIEPSKMGGDSGTPHAAAEATGPADQ